MIYKFTYYKEDCFGEIHIYTQENELVDFLTCDCTKEEFYQIFRIFKDSDWDPEETRSYEFKFE